MLKIGIGANWDAQKHRINMPNDYLTAVMRAGALPLLLPLTDNQDVWDAMVDSVDGMIFPGGEDFEPSYYGENTLPSCGEIVPERDRQELYTFGQWLKTGKPFLSICRGIQLVNVFAGGSLYQDLAEQFTTDIDHAQFSVSADTVHTVQVKAGTQLARFTGGGILGVNSRHHQAIKELGRGLIVSATAPDGLIEAVEYADGYPGLAVQFHPENLAKSEAWAQAMFHWLVAQAGKKQA